MLRNKKNQKYLASLFSAIYLFVALFSQSFHDHGSGEAFKDYQSTKADRTFTDSGTVTHYADCLYCHIVHEGKYISSPEFFFDAISSEEFQLEFFTVENSFKSISLYNFHPRGPPLFFV